MNKQRIFIIAKRTVAYSLSIMLIVLGFMVIFSPQFTGEQPLFDSDEVSFSDAMNETMRSPVIAGLIIGFMIGILAGAIMISIGINCIVRLLSQPPADASSTPKDKEKVGFGGEPE